LQRLVPSNHLCCEEAEGKEKEFLSAVMRQGGREIEKRREREKREGERRKEHSTA
jgi:hypothetical protein